MLQVRAPGRVNLIGELTPTTARGMCCPRRSTSACDSMPSRAPTRAVGLLRDAG